VITHLDLTLIIQVILFVAFLAVLNRLFYKPMATVLQTRAGRVEAGLRAAEESQRQTEEAQREVQRQLEEARAQARGIIAAAGKAAEEQRQALLAQARTEADALIAHARTEIQRERQAAVADLQRQVSQIAILAASKVVGKPLDSAAHRALAERTVDEVGAERSLAQHGVAGRPVAGVGAGREIGQQPDS
jgi:F-type H+-transporting ATPase subunit b